MCPIKFQSNSFVTYLNFTTANFLISFRVFNHEFTWTYKGKTGHNYDKDGDFYGIKGLKRVPNGWIAVLCIVFSAIGVCLQVLLIW
jgi:hypothetical protein